MWINVLCETSVHTDTNCNFPSLIIFLGWACMCACVHGAWHERLLGNSFVINHKEYLIDLGSFFLSILSSLFPFSGA